MNLKNIHNDIHSHKNSTKYFMGIDFKYFSILFAMSSMISILPQMYKIISTKRAQDFSMLFAFGMLTVNILFFIASFIQELNGMMLGTSLFIAYNSMLIYYYYFGIQK